MSQVPHGSIDRQAIDSVISEIVKRGLDPAKVVSCVPSEGLPGSVKGVRGCNQYDRCPFSQARYGGFKGFWRPKNVGYYVKPNDGTNHQKEDFLPCYLFVHTHMHRKYASDMAISQNKPGEFIDIIAQEGDLITINTWSPDPKHPSYGTPNPKFTNIRRQLRVPEYQHPADHLGDSYEADLERKRQKREEAMAQFNPFVPPRPTADENALSETEEADKVNALVEEWGVEKEGKKK